MSSHPQPCFNHPRTAATHRAVPTTDDGKTVLVCGACAALLRTSKKTTLKIEVIGR